MLPECCAAAAQYFFTGYGSGAGGTPSGGISLTGTPLPGALSPTFRLPEVKIAPA